MVENGHADSVKARNIFLPAKQDAVIREGSLVMLYLVSWMLDTLDDCQADRVSSPAK
jgi:hypothetical protein